MKHYEERIDLLYELPIVELLDLWFNRRNGKYAVRCTTGGAGEETVLWMTFRQFSSFLRQCTLHNRNDGLYARYLGLNFIYTVFGEPIRGSDYRLARCFDPVTKMLHRPVPIPLEVPAHVPIDETLLDLAQD